MTRTINELINPVALTVPTAKDLFSQLATGAPNSDPALRIAGASGTTDFQAYGAAPTMSKNIFKQKTYGWSFSCWLRTGGANHGGPLFVAQTAAATGSMSLDMPLYISWGSNGSVTTLSLQYYSASGSVNVGITFNNVNQWCFGVIRIPAAGNQITSIKGRADTALDYDFTNLGSMPGGSDTYNSGMNIAIGKYGPSSGPVGTMYGNTDFAKLCFHDHLLTITECRLLFDAMI